MRAITVKTRRSGKGRSHTPTTAVMKVRFESMHETCLALMGATKLSAQVYETSIRYFHSIHGLLLLII